ncbi:3'-5' exonuclease [Aliidiomarina quisquiliarum]|uniref:3'-5' exonuclease n=1 Tax=Aliidiomarina quisquiliarum TaxID=2938947 RepID=UPI00208E8085|nr:3'-5' exonuclease [Aliidiomarina quisquiliarum]MCO4321632.1 3'-5' exonuclease [Aliidiomarina quisquiliarum]
MWQGVQQTLRAWQQQRRAAKQSWRSVTWFAIDCETDGLDTAKNALLSLAWVPIEPPFVRLGASQYAVVQHQQPLSQSAVVHQLTSAELQQGEPLAQLLQRFAKATQGAYIVAHYAEFDRAILTKAMRQAGVSWQSRGWYDTLAVEKKQAAEKTPRQQHSFSLSASRARYGLLPMAEHHARNDAIGCGELFLAQVYRRQRRRKLAGSELTLGQVLRRGR